MPDTTTLERVSLAVAELAKGMKAVGFYPPGHPALIQALSRVVQLFEDVPLPDAGLEIDVSNGALLYLGTPIAPHHKAVADLNRDLYLRRASKVIFLPGMTPAETADFLSAVSLDAQDVEDAGGLERVLLRRKVSRIWIDKVDYDRLTELLKQEEAETPGEEFLPPAGESVPDAPEPPPEAPTVDSLLERIKSETDPAAYREHVAALTRLMAGERPDERTEHAARALAILAEHAERPPADNEEIRRLARLGIRELATDDMIAHFIGLLRDRGGRGRREAERVLTTVGERAVRPLLAALSGEEDLIVRKAIIDIVTRIGAPAVPAILENLSDSRWYVVRNMVTILGSLDIPELAPHVVTVLPHPDLRVKKEAIKALSRLQHPAAVQALGELCFFPEETVALSATAALAAKKEPESVTALHRRAVQRRLFHPHFRLAHEAIDSLRAIGTDEAVSALERIMRSRSVFETKKFRAMKIHALRSISKIGGDRPRAIVRAAAEEGAGYLRAEAERLLRREEQRDG